MSVDGVHKVAAVSDLAVGEEAVNASDKILGPQRENRSDALIDDGADQAEEQVDERYSNCDIDTRGTRHGASFRMVMIECFSKMLANAFPLTQAAPVREHCCVRARSIAQYNAAPKRYFPVCRNH